MGMDDRPSWLESQLMPLCRTGMFALGNYSIVSMLRLAKVVRLVKLVFCAAAAKQCGHIRHASSPTSPFAHSVELAYAQRQAMSRNIDFLWLGAKWYGQSIQLMTSDISLEASQTTPTQTHWTGLAVNSAASPLSRISTVSTEARPIAACVMCQYEELSAFHTRVGKSSRWAFSTSSPGQGRNRLCQLHRGGIFVTFPGTSASPTDVLLVLCAERL